MYLFATSIGLTEAASLLAAVLFNYSSFASVWLEFNTVWNTILWVPLILYLVEQRFKHSFSSKERLIFLFALFSSMTAGHPQDFINCLLFIIAYILFKLIFNRIDKPFEKKSIAIELSILGALVFLVGAIQLLPTIQLFVSSARVPHDIGYIIHNLLVQFWQFPIAIISDFFGNPATRTYVLSDTYVNKSLSIGVIGFILVIISLCSKKTAHSIFFTVCAAFILLLGTNNPISSVFYRFPLPLMSTGTPTRNFFIYIFSVSILAAFGYDSLKNKSKLITPFLILASIFFIIFVAYIIKPNLLYPFTPETIHTMKKSFLVAIALLTAGFGCIFVSKKFPLLLWGLILISIAELFWGGLKFNAFVPPTYVFPPNEIFSILEKTTGISRFWGYGSAQIEANYATQYHLYSPDGTDPLNLKWYNSLVQSSKDGQLPVEFTRITRSDAYIYPGYGVKDLPQNASRLRVLDALGVRYILDRTENPKDNETFSPVRFKSLWQNNDWTIYENVLAAPRYFLTSDVKYYTTDKEFDQIFFDSSFDPRSMIMLQPGDKTILGKKTSTDSVNLISYEPNKILFHVTTDTQQALFLSDTYDTGWKSYIDNKPTKTLKADYALRAVYIPKGNHIIRMEYAPTAFTLGVYISITGVLLSIIFVIFFPRIPNKTKLK